MVYEERGLEAAGASSPCGVAYSLQQWEENLGRKGGGVEVEREEKEGEEEEGEEEKKKGSIFTLSFLRYHDLVTVP